MLPKVLSVEVKVAGVVPRGHGGAGGLMGRAKPHAVCGNRDQTGHLGQQHLQADVGWGGEQMCQRGGMRAEKKQDWEQDVKQGVQQGSEQGVEQGERGL